MFPGNIDWDWGSDNAKGKKPINDSYQASSLVGNWGIISLGSNVEYNFTVSSCLFKGRVGFTQLFPSALAWLLIPEILVAREASARSVGGIGHQQFEAGSAFMNMVHAKGVMGRVLTALLQPRWESRKNSELPTRTRNSTSKSHWTQRTKLYLRTSCCVRKKETLLY